MNKNNHQNFDCRYAAEIVDFLYGEMDETRGDAFRQHLNKCPSCAGEIRDFSGINFSIKRWKAAEFDKISTPEIIIPYEKPIFKQVETVNNPSIFETVKSFFSLSPIFSGAAAIVAAVFLIAVSVFIFSGKDNDLVAENNAASDMNLSNSKLPDETKTAINEKSAAEIAPVEKFETDNAFENKNALENKNEKSGSAVISPSESRNKSVSNERNSLNKNLPEKVSTDKKQAVIISETKTAAQNKTASNNAAPKIANVKKKPRLNELPEEDEDKSLRLADLFAELETR